jgi:hypothetical protein
LYGLSSGRVASHAQLGPKVTNSQQSESEFCKEFAQFATHIYEISRIRLIPQSAHDVKYSLKKDSDNNFQKADGNGPNFKPQKISERKQLSAGSSSH